MLLKNIHEATISKRLSFIILAFILFPLLVAVSCASSIPQELAASKRLWTDRGLRNYDFTLERQCFCPEDWRGPVDIQVRDGAAGMASISITPRTAKPANTSKTDL